MEPFDQIKHKIEVCPLAPPRNLLRFQQWQQKGSGQQGFSEKMKGLYYCGVLTIMV